MTRQFVSPPNVHAAQNYSHAVKVNSTIYVSGQVGCNVDGSVVEGGFQAQAERAYENLRLVLEAAGASVKDVVKVNTYLTDMANRSLLNEVRRRYFSEPFPASTLVQISGLANPAYLIEVEAVAILD